MAFPLQSLIAPGAALGVAAMIALRRRFGRRDSGDSTSSTDSSSWWGFTDGSNGDSACDTSSSDCGGSDSGSCSE
jgi:hypothetical protein